MLYRMSRAIQHGYTANQRCGAAQLPAQIAIKPLPNPHAAAVAAEAEKDQAKELAATLRKAARSESLGRREAARAAQLADDTKRRKKV